ncbi:FAD-binding oxidoreductase [Pedobacter immunditicola]|uniref:FAD-binding oxidoreductase n=1 Tax=Pedobacter immunditicola TaxID=3133440 RepID=UPI00309B25B5
MKLYGIRISFLVIAAILIAAAHSAIAQTPDEHASHHPQQTPIISDTTTAMKPGAMTKDTTIGGMGGKKSGGMGDMMKEMGNMMGKPTNNEMYPTLMQVTDLTPEKRNEINLLANKLINEGNAILANGLKQLSDANRRRNMEDMQNANEQIRRGQIMLESGLDGRQALAEKDPRLTALQWFNREMNLTAIENEKKHSFMGLSWFHYMTMFLLTAFAIVMIWMYFHKMKRANALIEKLTGNTNENVPAPGDAKAGTPPPAADAENASVKVTAPAANRAGVASVVNPDIAPSKPNSWTGTLLVAEIFDETPNVKTFRLTDPEGGKIPFTYLPGQFLTVTINPTGVPVKRSYTIASSPTHRDYCEITVKHEEKGTVSHYMHTEVHVGELMQFTAPSGKFTFTETHAKSAVFIGGGVGLTPLMSAIRYLTDRSWKGEIYFFFSCKDESSIIFREEILYLQKRYSNLHVFFVLSQQQGEANVDFIPGYITKEIITERVPDILSRMIHICGPKPMMDAVKLMLDELKVPKENVMVEVFAGPPSPAARAPTAVPSNELVKPSEGNEARKFTKSEEDQAGVVTFVKSNKTAMLTPDKSVLEASEEVGVNIDYSCRVGTCGVCITKLISGKVTMAVEDALTEDDKAQNMILACQAKATEAISVDA